jgi:hypothetical protein
MLLKKFHARIYISPADIAERMPRGKLTELLLANEEENMGHGSGGIGHHGFAKTHEIINPIDGAARLWPLLLAKADEVFIENGRGKLVRQEPKKFKPDVVDVLHVVRYFLLYEPGKEEFMDEVFVKLVPQARNVMELLLEAFNGDYAKGNPGAEIYPVITDGKYISEPMVHRLILQNKDRLRTRQDPWRIFVYYRPLLINRNFLRIA